jgi:hypothetical protein
MYQCNCPDGSTSTSTCDVLGTASPLTGIIIGTIITVLVVVLVISLVVGLTLITYRYRRSNKYSITDDGLSRHSSTFEVHANIYAYDIEGGGEVDTNIDEHVNTPSMPKATIRNSPSLSTLDRARNLDDTLSRNNTNNTPPVRGTPSVRKITTVVNTAPTTENVIVSQSSPPIVHTGETRPRRASTPDIDAFIEDKVNSANKELEDIDSIKSFKDEGLATSFDSLSTLSVASFEPYTIVILRESGNEFQQIADILEPLYYSDDDDYHIAEQSDSFSSSSSAES